MGAGLITHSWKQFEEFDCIIPPDQSYCSYVYFDLSLVYFLIKQLVCLKIGNHSGGLRNTEYPTGDYLNSNLQPS